jgi:hypothetical protein
MNVIFTNKTQTGFEAYAEAHADLITSNFPPVSLGGRTRAKNELKCALTCAKKIVNPNFIEIVTVEKFAPGMWKQGFAAIRSTK